jgi:hypothetical protein
MRKLRMKLSAIYAVLSVATVACRPAESQSQSLSQDRRLPASLGMISNVIELKDGRVLFADTKSKLFLRADFRTGRLDTLGTRVDSLGPNSPSEQYRFPGWVAHLAGDTIALVDFSAIRTTLWNEAGRSIGLLPIKQVAGRTPILAYDTLGRGYKIDYQSVLGGGEPGSVVRPDSIVVLRIALPAGRVDTVARLASPEYDDAVFGEEVQQAVKVFAPNDFFGVLPDGTAWVARARENRVDWRSPEGKWTLGESRSFTKVAVTQADKERVLAQVREQGKQFGMPQDLRILYPFAETKPPFDLAVSSPDGEVWLQRPRQNESSGLVYGRVDRRRGWRPEVALPKDASLAGFGADGVVYGSVKNADGSRSLARFKLR